MRRSGKGCPAAARVYFEVPRGPGAGPAPGLGAGGFYPTCNEGYAVTSGADWVRPVLREGAQRLDRVEEARAEFERTLLLARAGRGGKGT